MKCNIDSRGRTLRIVVGGVVEAVGLLLVVFAAIGMLPPLWGFAIGGGLALAGVITMLQGFLGWCMARAVGIRTPV